MLDFEVGGHATIAQKLNPENTTQINLKAIQKHPKSSKSVLGAFWTIVYGRTKTKIVPKSLPNRKNTFKTKVQQKEHFQTQLLIDFDRFLEPLDP